MSVLTLIEKMHKMDRSNISEMSFKAGEIIIEKGNETPLYIIKSGLCKVFLYNAQGGEVLLRHMKPGSAIGEMSHFTGKSANANVISETETVLYELKGETLDKVIRDIPELARELYLQLCNNLENTNLNLSDKVEDLLNLNSTLEERVAEQVSDIKDKNKKLEEQNIQMKELLSSRDEFMNMMVHDLRAPLSNIIGYVELLESFKSIKEDQESSDVTKIINNNSSAMLYLINDILDYSKIESGHLELEKEFLEISELIKSSRDSNFMLYKAKDISLDLNIEEGLPKVNADPQRINEILNNLLNNALKFSERGTKVELAAKRKGDVIWIYVTDEGQGVPENELSNLFETFQQMTTTSTEGEKGSGLGLAIVKKLVELHGGQVQVSSKFGKGSVFSFSLPCS